MAKKAKQSETPKPPPWRWNAAKRRAAVLLAEDELTDAEIALECNTSRTVLWRWKRAEEFAAQVRAHVAELGAAAGRYAIARKQRRIRTLDDRWRRLHQVIEERAVAHAGAPGGSTGLLVRRVRSVGSGEAQQIVEEYELDAALLREAREHEKAAALELGQLDAAPPAEAPMHDQEEA